MGSVFNSAARSRGRASASSNCRACVVAVVTRLAVTCWPLIVMTRWKSPRAAGMAISVAHFAPPPDCPKIVTFPGLPPNSAALSRTHSSASTRSSIPALPESANSGPPISARYK